MANKEVRHHIIIIMVYVAIFIHNINSMNVIIHSPHVLTWSGLNAVGEIMQQLEQEFEGHYYPAVSEK